MHFVASMTTSYQEYYVTTYNTLIFSLHLQLHHRTSKLYDTIYKKLDVSTFHVIFRSLSARTNSKQPGITTVQQ